MFSAVPIGAALLSLLARRAWWMDGLCHFRLQYALALVPPAAGLAALRQWPSALAVGAASAFAAAPFVPFLPYRTAVKPVASEPTIRVVLSNVLKSNRDFELLRGFLRASNPDVVVLLEVDRAWMENVRDLMPHWKSDARSNNFGVALGSRIPFQHAELIRLGRPDLSAVAASIRLHGRSVTFVGTHPVTPGGHHRWSFRNAQLRMLGEWMAARSGPQVLLGDLNVTSCSPFFADFLQRARLRDTRRGRGIQTTWPTGEWPLRIAIDHCLVSSEFEVRDRRVGPHIGSDHFPVIADLTLPSSGRQPRPRSR